MSHIINISINLAIWPNKAEVIPLYKSGKKSIKSNYRPISLISNVAKIFEKVMYFRIFYFIKSCRIISDRQFGFVNGRGTKDALKYVTNILYNNLDKSRPTLLFSIWLRHLI